MNHALHGLAPVGYHVANVLLHAAVSVLVLIVCGARSRRRGPRSPRQCCSPRIRSTPRRSRGVVGRAEVLAAGGFFLAWLAWLRGRRRRARAGRDAGVPAWLLVVAAVAAVRRRHGRQGERRRAAGRCSWSSTSCGRGTARRSRRSPPRAPLCRARRRGRVLRRAAPEHRRTHHPPRRHARQSPGGAADGGAGDVVAVKVLGLYAWRLLVPLQPRPTTPTIRSPR